MNWLITAFTWYSWLFLIGLIFFPVAAKIFPSFADRGYAFSKTLAILFLSYAVFVLGIFKILPFTQSSIFVLLIFVVMGFIVYLLKKYPSLPISNFKFQISNFFIFIIEEILFLAAFIFLTYVRGQEPSIHGLEKFMDFGFMQSILRSQYFPPKDMWLTPFPINYYYFGHLTGAFLIKLTGVKPQIGYNLILATILGQGAVIAFSLTGNLVYLFQKLVLKIKQFNLGQFIFFGILGSFIVNLAGNLHTIYLFTTGYPNDNPIPFWQIFAPYNPTKYWYPNATRFIPFTIHEFPSYSYVVADLHGHVFDIPFVLLTLAILFKLFIDFKKQKDTQAGRIQNSKFKIQNLILNSKFLILNSVFLGFMTAIHYMTNAFDGPIYILLSLVVFLAVYGISWNFLYSTIVIVFSFLIFSLPFSAHFSPFVSGIGMNCAPDFLVNLQKLGPFLFEKGNCQPDPFWMLFVLWGFFWVCFILFLAIQKLRTINHKPLTINHLFNFDSFIFILFSFGTFLILIPEFFYIKDIYPAHFRANTMFKLGYQAFMMMGIACAFTFYLLRLIKNLKIQIFLKLVFLFFFFFIFIYPFFSFPSYYGKLDRPVELDGSVWLAASYPEDKEIIDYLNSNVADQPVILEAQGDSYTDYERISAYTGLPTVAGWWVHEWLWRGSADVVGKRIPDIVNLYESADLELTKNLIKKYQIEYVIISGLEKQKYKNINFAKFDTLGRKIFESSNKNGALYQLNKF